MNSIENTNEKYLKTIFIKLNSYKENGYISKYHHIFNELNCIYSETIINNIKYILLYTGAGFKKNMFDILTKYFADCKIFNFNAYKFYFIDEFNGIKIKCTKITKNWLSYINKVEELDYKDLSEFLNENVGFKSLFSNTIFNESSKPGYKNHKSKVIKIRNIKDINWTLAQIMNLFSLFGNIKNIFYNFYNSYILIGFDKVNGTQKVLKYKNLLKYNNKLINIKSSNLNLNELYRYGILKTINFSNKFIRKNLKIKAKFNPPSKLVHISNISSNVGNFEFYNFIKKYQEPLLIKFIKKKDNSKKMCMVLFKNIAKSVDCIMDMNNKILNNRKIKIIFSFNKLRV